MKIRTIVLALALAATTALAAATPLRYEVVDLLQALPALPKTPAEAVRHVEFPSGKLKAAPLEAYKARLDAYVKGHQQAYQTAIQPNVDRSTKMSGAAVAAGGMDFQRMQTDPDYAAAQQARIAKMSQAEQMAMAMQMQQAMMGQATSGPAADSSELENSDAVEAAVEHVEAQTSRLMDAHIAGTQQALATGGDPWGKQAQAMNAAFDARAVAIGTLKLDAAPPCATYADGIAHAAKFIPIEQERLQAAQALANKLIAERRQFLAKDVALLNAGYKDFRGAGKQRLLEYETQAAGYANYPQLTDFWADITLKAARRQHELDRWSSVPAGKRNCSVCGDGLNPGDVCYVKLPD